MNPWRKLITLAPDLAAKVRAMRPPKIRVVADGRVLYRALVVPTEEEKRARPGLQYRVAREVPGEEGEEDPGKPQEGQEEGPGKLHLVEDPGEAVAHGPEAPGPVDLHLKAAEGVAQGLTPVLSADLGFPFREKGSGGGHPLFSQTCYPPR